MNAKRHRNKYRYHLLLLLALALALLAACGGDDDDAPADTQPAATATTAPVPATDTAPPAATPTAAVAPATPTVPTSTEPAATPAAEVAPQPFRVEVMVDALPEGSDFLEIERVTWRRFGGTDENAVTAGVVLVYQDAGTESCFVGRPEAQVFRAGGAADGMMSTDITAPTTINAGDYYLLPPSMGNNCKNIGATDSTSLGFSVFRGGDPGEVGPIPGGLIYDLLTKGDAPSLPTGPVTLSLERVILDPGDELPIAEGAWMQVFVESGSLTVSGDEATTVTRNLSAAVERATAEAELAAGDGATIAPESAMLVTNTGDAPASVLVCTVVPAT